MSPWLQPHLDAAGGALRFDRFMELALYDPDHGYYTSRISTVGFRGDFSTSATLSGALARALAGEFIASRQTSAIEIGAGSGELLAGFRRSLPLLLRLRTRFHLVERSPRLREAQRELLGRRIRWHETPSEALGATGQSAFVFSNELVDAFPVRVFRSQAGAWQELFLAVEDGGLEEAWHPCDVLPDSTVFDHPWRDGQRLEVHDSCHAWLADWLPHWKGKRFLIIDYGGTPAELYHRRPAGTLRGYLHHQVLHGPELYRHPGRHDLTADVNFSDLQRWSRQIRPDCSVSLTTQREFLAPHTPHCEATRFLTDPDGAGTAFKVLTLTPEP